MSMQSVYLKLDEIRDDHNIKDIKAGVDRIKGIHTVSISRNDNIITVDYDDADTKPDEITDMIKKMGYHVTVTNDDLF